MASGLGRDWNNHSNLDWQLDKASSWRSARAWWLDRPRAPEKLLRDRGGSQRDARAVSPGGDPGSCDPPTHRGNHSKSCESLKKIVQEFANNSTTGQEAMQIGLVDAGATAPTTAWPPSVAETFEESWRGGWCCQRRGFTTVLDPPRIRSRVPGLSQRQEQGQTRTTSARARAHTNGNKGNHDGNKGSNYGMYKGGGRANSRQGVPERRRQVWIGQDPSWQVLHLRWRFARDCPKGGGKGGFRALEAWETWEEPPLVEHVCVLSSLREAPPKDSQCRKN